MGLDMYLTKQYYVKRWSHQKPSQKYSVTVTRGKKRASIPRDKITYIETEEIYWRKANQIHKWFVDHCQEGVDDCRKAYVEVKKLEELLDTINTVLESTELVDGNVVTGMEFDPKKKKDKPIIEKGKVLKDSSTAESLLPATAGFFFGGTEYDQWYWDDLVFTKKELERVIKEDKEDRENFGTFYYQSSW